MAICAAGTDFPSGGISPSRTRLSKRLAAGSPGTIAGPFLPPRTAKRRNRRSKPPFSSASAP